VERDVTETGGCGALGVRTPTTSDVIVPQLLAAERRRHRVLLLVGERASPPVPGSAVQAQRPTSFQPALMRCVTTAEDRGGESDRRRGEVVASRTWRHVDEVLSAAGCSRQAAHATATAAAAAVAGTLRWIIAPR